MWHHPVMWRTSETFLVLLNKIVKPEDQEKAVEKAIEGLAYNDIVTSSLLDALKGKTFRNRTFRRPCNPENIYGES